ncbi:hypothetical protein MPER_06807 [Moniliophthora perniciosa FA553]|nr:hypothetical protein MPER_06807 [Moniliophthora perniciosa FA553]
MDKRQHFRRAFLSQSLVFMKKAGVDFDSPPGPRHCYLLDFVQIKIKGQFEPLHSAASADPIYLFVGPLEWEDVDRMYCLKCPLDSLFAHWSLDPDGPSASFNADEYGLPQLEQTFSVGAWWDLGRYKVIEEYLRFKQYDPYSTAYAEDKGYPLLTYRNIGPVWDHQSVMEVFNAFHRSNQQRKKKEYAPISLKSAECFLVLLILLA